MNTKQGPQLRLILLTVLALVAAASLLSTVWLGSQTALWVLVAALGLAALVAVTWPGRPGRARQVSTPWGPAVVAPISLGSKLMIAGYAAGLVLSVALFLGEANAPWWAFLLLAPAALLVPVAYKLLRWSSTGILPGWKEPLLDPSLPALDAGTPEEWLAGRGSLGGGGAGTAMTAAAALRAVWWEPEPEAKVTQLRWRINPDPSETELRRATRAGLRAARRALPGRGGVRVRGGWRRLPGPDEVQVRLVVRCHRSGHEWLEGVAEAFAREFERRLAAGHQLVRMG